MSPTTTRPEQVIDRFAELIGAGDVDATLALYEEDATFAPEPDRTVRGTDAIRAELERFAALNPRITGTIERVIEADDTALVINRWRLRGTGPDGVAVEMSARSADILRRGPGAQWRILIDDPWGATPG
jgi:ketosteroid isomerase-like protein